MEGVYFLPLILSQAVRTACEPNEDLLPIEIYSPPHNMLCGCILIPPPYAVFQTFTNPIRIYQSIKGLDKTIHPHPKDSMPYSSNALGKRSNKWFKMFFHNGSYFLILLKLIVICNHFFEIKKQIGNNAIRVKMVKNSKIYGRSMCKISLYIIPEIYIKI